MHGHRQLRREFLDFFQERDHKLVPSASLVPRDDPSLLFTVAGMVQFKSFYSTTGELPYRRAISIQKCLRAGGKDSDLENVGRSSRHLTFFEMLGHFSFGDYFKAEAVAYAWEFFTRILDVDRTRLWVTVFEEDDEAAECWRKVGFPAERIVRLGVEDNFWGPAGSTGACGPSSEIYWDLGAKMVGGEVGGGPGKDDRYIEVWNAVFPQFDQQPDGSRTELPNKGIDMGSGLERMAVMLQDKQNIFETDLFRPIMDGILELAGYDGPEEGEALVAFRRVADHARALAYALSEGLVPSNIGRGYVLRRILRRAMMALRTLDVHEPMLHKVLSQVTDQMSDVHPELSERAERSAAIVRSEEERFLRTLEQGIGRYRDLVKDLRSTGGKTLSGPEVFKLYSTYGIPWELTAEMAAEEDLKVDEAGYRVALEADRQLSQAASAFGGDEDPGGAELRYEALANTTGASEFSGHAQLGAEVHAVEWRDPGEDLLELVLDRTPFYATSGGQIADEGKLDVAGKELVVVDVQKRGSRIVHRVRIPEDLSREELLALLASHPLFAQVDGTRRQAIARAHTGTHLLHAALHHVIGEEATQAGSWVGPDRLRFDFNHFQAVSAQELARVEELVALWILENLPVRSEVLSLDEALERGAMALFGEKYGEEVRTVSIGGVSLELCGGTHLEASGAIGSLLISSEGSVASGVRRIEAITGMEAQRLVSLQRRSLGEIVRRLRVPEEELPEKLDEIIAERLKLRKNLEGLRAKQAAASSEDLLKEAGTFGGLVLVEGEISAENPKEIRSMADSIRQRLDDQVAALLARAGGKLSFLVLVPDALAKDDVHAGNLVSEAAAVIGGRGGGSPTLAQAGLGEADEFPRVLDALGSALSKRGEAE